MSKDRSENEASNASSGGISTKDRSGGEEGLNKPSKPPDRSVSSTSRNGRKSSKAGGGRNRSPIKLPS